MWNRKTDTEPRPQTPPAPVSHQPYTAPPQPQPVRVDPPPKRSATILGPNVSVKGEIYSEEDLTIDGDVEGTVELKEGRLTIGPHGKLRAQGLAAREVDVQGVVQGNVRAVDKVFIRKDASLVGDVQTAGIVIEDGAYFKGGIDIQTRK